MGMLVGVVARKGNDRAASLAGDLRERLSAVEASVRIDEATADALGVAGTPVDQMHECDLVVSVGGDGTFLFAARGAAGTPVLGVNLGEVGFLNAVSPEAAVETVEREVEAYHEGGMRVREAPRLAARSDGWRGEPAANEVLIQGPRRGHGGGVDLDVYVDGSRYDAGRADGVLVATPTGSTAYNLSEGGPLVHPSLDALIVNQMCAADGMPPLLVDLDSTVRVEVSGAPAALVVSDGRVVREFDTPTAVEVVTTDPPVRLAGPAADFFEALDKLE